MFICEASLCSWTSTATCSSSTRRHWGTSGPSGSIFCSEEERMGLNFPHQHRRQSSGDPATHPVSCIHLQNCFVDVYSDRAFGSELCSLLERDAATLLFFFLARESNRYQISCKGVQPRVASSQWGKNFRRWLVSPLHGYHNNLGIAVESKSLLRENSSCSCPMYRLEAFEGE